MQVYLKGLGHQMNIFLESPIKLSQYFLYMRTYMEFLGRLVICEREN